MGRAQFEYDEVGNTFYYVIVSFYAVVLIPLTHFLWPSLPKKLHLDRTGCQCEGDVAKRSKKDAVKPWEHTKRAIKAVVLLVLWIGFAILAYNVSQIEHEHTEYDPYKILGLDTGADVSEIKKKYRELSKKLHPDRGGDAQAFDNIAKAYQALTDDESRENWEKYGNPDGPKATTFGIALPKWIVSEQYGIWVLAFYGFLFMIILPTGVGFWWYNSMKYSADKVLLETTRLYYHFLQKTPSMEINRTIMVIAGSFEFWKKFNTEIVERESDDVEVPRLMKELRNLGENKKEAPFCHPWSVKARALLHAHLSRIDVGSPRLEADEIYMVGRLLPLIEEFIRALWPRNSGLLQLPHLTEQNVPFLRKNRVATCEDLANLSEHRRRALLNTVTEQQYEDIIYVLGMMPRLEVEAKIEVQGEDDKDTVTVGSVVTLKVTLRRGPLLDPKKREQELRDGPKAVDKEKEEREDAEDAVQQPKRKVWEKPPKKKAKKGGKGGGKPLAKKKPTAVAPTENGEKAPDGSVNGTAPNSPKATKSKEGKKKEKAKDESEDESGTETDISESDSERSEEDFTKHDPDRDVSEHGDSEEDDLLDDHEGLIKKETLLESEPTTHHEVHCPFFPGDKYEWWYLYLVDRKSRRLVSMVVPCKTLNKEKTVELRFSAPPQKGTYYFILNVRSDSYMDSDYTVDVKMEVLPAREPPVVKYEDTEDEKEEGDASESTEDYTEGSDSEQDED
ncbi:Protein DNJ-29 a [Aphelenchoides avenae]|nr:Protein DNJ-29 a [Aphelenchus avenae]